MKDYFEGIQRLIKLEVYEVVGVQIGLLIWRILLALAIFFLSLMLSLAAGFYFGELLNSNWLGFLAGAGIILFDILILLIFKRAIVNLFIGQSLKSLRK